MPRSILMAVLLGLTAASAAVAQEPPPPTQPLRVFLDCQRCDFDHLRREVTFVDYVREPADAQLHVLVTTQQTGGGGDEYTLYFIGQREFAARSDTLRFATRRDETDEERRATFTRMFALGLVPFAARSGIAPGLSVSYEASEDGVAPAPVEDPWNLWVFRAHVGASFDGESRQNSGSFEGSLSAGRTTDQLKVDFSLRGEYEQQHFELSDGDEIESITRDYDSRALVVWSLGTHWSTGVSASAGTSTRLNQDLAVEAAPAIEYNLYPYSESTRRQILFTYTVGPVRYEYRDSTLFDRLSETLVHQRFQISAAFEQPWGEVDASFEASSFLHDLSYHRIDLFSSLDIRLFRGLSLNLFGSVARVKDQLYLSRQDLTDDEILLELRELGTDFEYDFNVGFSYSFGSVFNNVVNPRLRLGSGGGRRFR